MVAFLKYSAHCDAPEYNPISSTLVDFSLYSANSRSYSGQYVWLVSLSVPLSVPKELYFAMEYCRDPVAACLCKFSTYSLSIS